MNYTFRAEVSKNSLDLQFYANYGQRNPSPIVEAIQDNYGEVLTSEELTTLAGVVLEMYKEKWDKLGAIYDIQYDPIHNYLDQWNDEMEGEESREGSDSKSGTITYGKMITDTLSRSDTLSSTVEEAVDDTRTRTDDLVKTETRNLHGEDGETRDLTDATTFGKTNTRTDNLSELMTYGRSEARTINRTISETSESNKLRTDALTETTNYGKSDAETKNLKHEIKGTETTTPADGSTQSVYAFNSSSGLPTDSSVNSGMVTLQYGNRENDDTGTDTHVLSGSDSVANTGTQSEDIDQSIDTSEGTRDNLEYDGTDERTNTGTQANALSGTNSTRSTGTRTVEHENTGTITTSDEGTETTTDSRERVSEMSGTNSRTQNSTSGYTGTDRNASSGTNSESITNNRERSGRHFGNIGNLTSQKQILEEINLWKWSYVKDILSDVKEFCTLPVYLNATEWQLVDPDEN